MVRILILIIPILISSCSNDNPRLVTGPINRGTDPKGRIKHIDAKTRYDINFARYVKGKIVHYADTRLYIGIDLKSSSISESNISTSVNEFGETAKIGKTQFDNNTAIGLKFGLSSNTNRYELEYYKGTNGISNWFIEDSGSVVEDVNNAELTTSAINFNYYHDFRFNNHFAIYLGGGVGRIHSELIFPDQESDVRIKSDDTFSYQFMGGITVMITDENRINIGYRHNELFSDFKYKYSVGNYDNVIIDYKSRTIEIGYKYFF